MKGFLILVATLSFLVILGLLVMATRLSTDAQALMSGVILVGVLVVVPLVLALCVALAALGSRPPVPPAERDIKLLPRSQPDRDVFYPMSPPLPEPKQQGRQILIIEVPEEQERR